MQYKVLGGSWETSKKMKKHELVLGRVYELETLHFVNTISQPSKLQNPNEWAQWSGQQEGIEQTYRALELNLGNMDIVLDELIEEYVTFDLEEE